jgi:hypothetical protein
MLFIVIPHCRLSLLKPHTSLAPLSSVARSLLDSGPVARESMKNRYINFTSSLPSIILTLKDTKLPFFLISPARENFSLVPVLVFHFTTRFSSSFFLSLPFFHFDF